MELKDIRKSASYQKLNSLIESRYGFRIDFDTMTPSKAATMINFITESQDKIRRSAGSHAAARDPRYLEMQLVKESLSKYMKDYKPTNAPGKKSAPKLEPVKAPSARSVISEMSTGRNFQMISRAIELASQGKSVPGKYMEGFVPLIRQIYATKLTEGELGKSETILAAKSMVDSLQDMVEELGRMLNEELPPLVDSIRDQVSAENAQAFSDSVNQTLTGLLDSVKTSKDALDASARQLAGEQVAMPMQMPGDQEQAAGDIADDVPDADEFAGVDAAAGGDQELGREER
jgi:hypothetical protein